MLKQNETVLVLKKGGYSAYAEVNPVTKRLSNFSVKGIGVNPNATYTTIMEVESIIDHFVKKVEQEKSPKTTNKKVGRFKK